MFKVTLKNNWEVAKFKFPDMDTAKDFLENALSYAEDNICFIVEAVVPEKESEVEE